MHRSKTSFAFGSSATVKAEHEGTTATWLAGTLGGAKCAGTWTASTAGVMALSGPLFKPLVPADQEISLASLSPQLCPFRR